jgi:hypothetical protein
MDPVDLVQAQVEARSARDLERFLACDALDAVIENRAGAVMMRGHDALRACYRPVVARSHCGFVRRPG